MEDLKLARILPYVAHAGIELYLDGVKVDNEDYLKIMDDSYNYIVTKIVPYDEIKLEIHITKIIEREAK